MKIEAKKDRLDDVEEVTDMTYTQTKQKDIQEQEEER